MKNLGINFYHCLPTHLSTILLRRNGPISKSISKRCCQVAILFSRLFCPALVSIDYILDSKDQAVCIVEITKVSVQPFHQVSADHAYKEGEGDKSLAYWHQVHEDFFKDCLGEAGLTFTPDSKVVLEEFRKVYPL